MANAVLAYPNWMLPQYDVNYTATPSLLTPTLSGGNWNANFPLTNLLLGQLGTPIRSVGTSNANTQFTVDYGTQGRPFSVFALVRHNLTPQLVTVTPARWRVTLSNDNFATTVWTSGWVNAYQPIFAPGSLPMGWSPGVWNGGPTQFDLRKYKSFASPIMADQIYQSRYLKIEIDDTGNTNGYIQIGGVFAGPGYQPNVNIAYGAQIGWTDESLSDKAWSGVKYFSKRPRRRAVQFVFQAMSFDQGMEIPFEIEGDAGITEQLFFMLDPTSAYHLNRWSFLANIDALDPVLWPSFNLTSAQLRLLEVL